ncbi:MAG: sn-glycerol-3-phosphate ABC transporter ATP-binding protein UgpC [Acidimicrobiia bacterium]|nr:sn-glycerol-3-phosphate ABC transporter ATP-binding protein UgpC [Acidimicrobiia bacterium]MDH5504232.1 sn-glycerol-3-phosphate ABC transporter ATP-binding protein UgpC [Acidimicrobiia bacterium]
MASISLDGIGKIYEGGTRALTDVNLEINDGEFMVLVGPSGCGKSTLLRMIAGLEDITEGTMKIGDTVVNDIPPKDRNIAMVFQNYALYPHMTVFDNMAFGLKLRKMPKDEITRRVEEAAKVLEITEYLPRKPKALSGGQRQRVAMGRAIVREPAAFLMDEPLSNLDAKLRVQMRSELGQLHARLKTTTVYVTHDQVEAMTMGDRVAVMRKGIIEQAASPRELYDEPVNLFVAGFIGSPSMNLVYADLTDSGDGMAATFGDSVLRLDSQNVAARPGLAAYAGKQIVLGIRPEAFEAAAAIGAEGDVPVKVSLVEQLGSEAFVHFEYDSRPVVTQDIRELLADEGADESTLGSTTKFVARINPDFAPALGDDIRLAVDTAKLHFFDPDTSQAIY